MVTISLCMITKNEEFFLADCLNSVKELVNEIVIIDTGSTDKTKEIASSFGAKIVDFEWCDDFSAARNESLKHATSDWILVLDADEVIAKNDLNKICNLINLSSAEGYILIQRNYFKSEKDLHYGSFKNIEVSGAGQANENFVYAKEDQYLESRLTIGWMPTPIVRLFKNKGFSFSGVVHEDISESINGTIVETDIPIHHFGKIDSKKWHEKWKLYEKLGEKKVQEEKDYHAYFELGRQYLEVKKFELAKKMFKKSIILKNDFWLSWFNLGSIAIIEEDFETAIFDLKKAKDLNPQASIINSNLGVVYARQRRFKEAIESFSVSLQLQPNQADVFYNLGLCYHEKKDPKLAILAFEKAIELNPKYKEEIQIE